MDQGKCLPLFLGFALCRGRQTNEREDRAHAARSEEGREVGRRSPDADGRTVAPRVRVLAVRLSRPSLRPSVRLSVTGRTLQERDKNSNFSGGMKLDKVDQSESFDGLCCDYIF